MTGRGPLGLSYTAKLCTLLIAAAWSACAPSRNARVSIGKTTERELHAAFGEPSRILEVKDSPGSTVHEYAADRSGYQLSDGVVVLKARDPDTQERALQYWRHRWKGKRQSDVPATPSADPHADEGRVLRNEDDGLAVMYRPGSGEVFRVLEY